MQIADKTIIYEKIKRGKFKLRAIKTDFAFLLWWGYNSTPVAWRLPGFFLCLIKTNESRELKEFKSYAISRIFSSLFLRFHFHLRRVGFFLKKINIKDEKPENIMRREKAAVHQWIGITCDNENIPRGKFFFLSIWCKIYLWGWCRAFSCFVHELIR